MDKVPSVFLEPAAFIACKAFVSCCCLAALRARPSRLETVVVIGIFALEESLGQCDCGNLLGRPNNVKGFSDDLQAIYAPVYDSSGLPSANGSTLDTQQWVGIKPMHSR